jgi:hypothetical protein
MGKREAADGEEEQYRKCKTASMSRRNSGKRIYATNDEKC